MLRYVRSILFLVSSLAMTLCFTTPLAAQPPNCSVIPNVTAAWQPGSTPPPGWQGADPAILTDGDTTNDWYYYWEGGTQIPVVFTLPAGYDVTAVSWHDHFGDGTVTLTAGGQTLSFSTDLWPLDWHQEAWSLSGVTSVELTTSSNNTKISELAFCGTQGVVDVTPPEVVQGINLTQTCTSIDVSWSPSQDFDNSGNPSGFADRYLVSWNGLPAVEVFGTSLQISATPETFYSIELIAVDVSGNQSAPVTVTTTTPACPPPPTGDCTTVAGVTVDWQPGNTPPAPWQAPSPSILVDGQTNTEWFYYWEPTPPVPVIFTLPAGTDISGVRWNDHHGDGDILLQANGQSTTISTDLWPLDWHIHPWVVTNVSTVSMTTSSNNTKFTELTFCGAGGSLDTVPPDAVDDLVGTVTGCTSANFTWSATTDYDANGPNGTASSYLLSAGSNPAVSVMGTSRTLTNLTPDATNLVTIIAVDAAGNESLPYSISVVTPACTGGLDAYPATVHIIDSFGQQVAPDTSGHQWHGIDEYYAAYYNDGVHNWSQQGMCSKDIHNSYWVLADENGQPPGSADYDNDGDYESYYPTWHPPIHDEGGPNECYFMHEHGEDPRTSPFYDVDDALSIGVPFGYVHSKMGNMNGRLEGHPGHKVIVQNDFTLVNGNPYGVNSVFDEIGVNCNWLSKIHQGSHSSDALGNNLHEYFLNVECDDAASTHIRFKELVTWGYPNKVYNEGSEPAPNVPTPCSPGIRWFWAGFEAGDPVHSPVDDPNHFPPGATPGPFSDGKREFGCYADRHNALYNGGPYDDEPKPLAELWKPDSEISAPQGGGAAIVSPYYATFNPTRYVDPNWVTRFDNDVYDTYLGFSCDGGDSNGISSDDCVTNQDCMLQNSGRHDGCEGTGAMVSSVDLCVRGSDAWQYSILAIDPSYASNSQYPGFCDILDSGLRTTWEQEIVTAGGDTLALSNARKYHPDNPFDGTRRGVHPKTLQVYQAGSASPNYLGLKVFCTDAFANNPSWPTFNGGVPSCPTGTLMQAISPLTNGLGGSQGSSVGATYADGTPQNPNVNNETGLRGGGEGAEFVIDGISDPANKVRPPN